MPEPLALGIDIGGTKTELALVDGAGQIRLIERMPTDPHTLIDRLAEVGARLIEWADGDVIGVGVGVPGYVDPATGMVLDAVNLGWHEMPLGQTLRERLRLPVTVHKDANAAALGEMRFGAAQGATDILYVAIGTGLGVGVVVNGQVVSGRGGAAGEIAHIGLDDRGRLCRCGLRGCPEMYMSGIGLVAGAREHWSAYPDSTLNPLIAKDTLTAHEVVAAFHAGDSLAQTVLDEAFAHLAEALTLCVGLLNPERIVLGGGLGVALAEWLIPDLEAHLRAHTHEAAHRGLRIVASWLQSLAVGAASLVR